jgi:hypothetical protein
VTPKTRGWMDWLLVHGNRETSYSEALDSKSEVDQWDSRKRQ